MLVTVPMTSIVCHLKRYSTDNPCFTEVLAVVRSSDISVYDISVSPTKAADHDGLRVRIVELYPQSTKTPYTVHS